MKPGCLSCICIFKALMLGYNSPWLSHFCTACKQRRWLPLCPDYFFKDVCIANSCGRYYICFTARAGLFTVQCNKNSFPLWQRASLLTVHCKLGFSPKMQPISYAPVTYPFLPHPVGTGPPGTYKKWYSSHCLLMSNKLLFVSDLEISCLLSEFMKLWQVNLLLANRLQY